MLGSSWYRVYLVGTDTVVQLLEIRGAYCRGDVRGKVMMAQIFTISCKDNPAAIELHSSDEENL
jgi:hypothetical protein